MKIFILSSKKNYHHSTELKKILKESNVNIIFEKDYNIFNFDKNDIVIFMNSFNLIENSNFCKIALIYKLEDSDIEYLKLFDYVLCHNNLIKKHLETKNIMSYILPISTNFINMNFNTNPDYDILINQNINKRKQIVDIALKLKKLNYKVKICGSGWSEILKKEEFNLLKEDYFGNIINDKIKEYYLNSKIVIDDDNEDKFGKMSRKGVDVISCKRIFLTNNLLGNKELFENKLSTYNKYEDLIILIEKYMKDDKYYLNKVNELYKYCKVYLNDEINKKFLDSLLLFTKNNTKVDIVLKICGRPKDNFTFSQIYQWGDFYMASDIKKNLKLLFGLECQICMINDWYKYNLYSCENIIFIRGIYLYKPNLNNNNMVLFISHPELYSKEEFSKYDKIICCSNIFYKKIKEELNLNDDKIIFSLQPIDLNKELNFSTNYEYDAIFVGNNIRNRKSISWLNSENLKKVKIFGSMWKDPNIKSLDNNLVFEHYMKSKIILNDNWNEMSINGFINNRVLEGLITGNYILTDNVEGLNKYNFRNLYEYKNKEEYNQLFKNLVDKKINKDNNFNFNIIKKNNENFYFFISSFVKFNIKNNYENNQFFKLNKAHFKMFNLKLNILLDKIKEKPKIILKNYKFNQIGIIEKTKVFCMVKNELDIIEYFIKWNSYLCGISNLYIIDNLSDDGTWEYLSNVKKKYNNFNLFRTPDDFNFVNKKDFINEIVNKNKLDSEFILILDCDEFLIAKDNDIKKQFDIFRSDKHGVCRLPDYRVYNYKNNFQENIDFIDDASICFRDTYAKCLFKTNSFKNITDNGNHNFKIRIFLKTELRILHFHNRNIFSYLSKKMNILKGYLGKNFNVENINKNRKRSGSHVAEELMNFLTNKHYDRYKDKKKIQISILKNYFENIDKKKEEFFF